MAWGSARPARSAWRARARAARTSSLTITPARSSSGSTARGAGADTESPAQPWAGPRSHAVGPPTNGGDPSSADDRQLAHQPLAARLEPVDVGTGRQRASDRVRPGPGDRVLARGPRATGESRHLAPGDVVHGERDVHRLGEREADPRTVDAGVRYRPGELHARLGRYAITHGPGPQRHARRQRGDRHRPHHLVVLVVDDVAVPHVTGASGETEAVIGD